MFSYILYFTVLFLSCLVKGEVLKRLLPMKLERGKTFLALLIFVLVESLLPAWGQLLEPVFFLGMLIYLRPAWKVHQYLFYALLPFVAVDMTERLLNSVSLKNPEFFSGMDSSFLNGLELVSFFIIALVAPFLLFLLFTKVFRIDFTKMSRIFTYPSFGKTIWFFDMSLLLYSFLAFPLFILQGQEAHSSIALRLGNVTAKIEVLGLQLSLFLVFILYFNFKIKEILDKENADLKEQQLEDLSRYSQHVESLYKELRSFRHDYTNVLVSLNESIKNRDMDQVEQIYTSVLASSDKRFYDSKYEIPNLSNLTDPAMKSLVSAKLTQSVELGIEAAVEIPEPIGLPQMEVLDLMKVLSIFLDNAIEASQEATKPSLAFAYFKLDKQTLLVIENSIKEEKIRTQALFKEGYSSKGQGRGIGLATVQKISHKYPHLSLQTTSNKYRFRQELTFYDRL